MKSIGISSKEQLLNINVNEIAIYKQNALGNLSGVILEDCHLIEI